MNGPITLTLECDACDGRAPVKLTFTLDAQIQVNEQLTTWTRRCAVEFYRALRSRSDPMFADEDRRASENPGVRRSFGGD